MKYYMLLSCNDPYCYIFCAFRLLVIVFWLSSNNVIEVKCTLLNDPLVNESKKIVDISTSCKGYYIIEIVRQSQS